MDCVWNETEDWKTVDNAVCFASLRRLKMDCVWNETEDWKTVDNVVCYASLRRLKMDCVWNETEDWKTGNGIVTGKTTRQESQMETDPKKNWKMHLVNHIKVVLTASGTRDIVLLEKSTE